MTADFRKSEALSAVLMKLGEAAYQGEQDMADAQADDRTRAKIMMMWWMPSLKRLMMTKMLRKPDLIGCKIAEAPPKHS